MGNSTARKKIAVTVMMPEDELDMLRIVTAKKDMSLSAYIRKSTRDALEVEQK